MSGELLSSEQVQELQDSPEPQPRGGAIQLVPVPVSIRVKDWGVLDCGGDNSWGYTPYGIFATGKKRGHDYGDQEPAEHDVLFPYNSIVAVEFDYPTYFESQGLTPTGEAVETVEGDAEEVTPDGDADSGD